MDVLSQVLGKRNIPAGFALIGAEKPYYLARFSYLGETCDLEVYPDTVVMTSGDRLYEIYLTKEFRSPEIEIESFARRLDRYLGGGPWEEPEEQTSILERLLDRLRSGLRRWWLS